MSTKVFPDSAASIQFLQRWSPSGPWVLTAIQTDRKSIATRTFHPADLKSLEAWLSEFNGKRNIYFHVNPPLRDLTKKAEREDIKSVDWLHVDIDPRAGEDIEEEQRRALGLLTNRLPKGVPAPTVVVFSGGGYQGFWKLEKPIPIEGDLEKAEDAKRYNQQLEILFGADNCHNIDRIMRLPGTVNIPDARKLKKGRQPMLASLVEFDDSRVYPVAQFTAAPAVQMKDDHGFTAAQPMVKISGNIDRIADLSELDQWSVPDRTKVIIAQGRHPDEVKSGDNSRSAWLFDAICQLVRCDVPDETIFSIITDHEFGISESVVDKGTNAEKYAIRQIERAKEEAIDPHFRLINERHAVIRNIGGKCRVIEEVWDEALERTRLTRISFEDFRNSYSNIKVLVGTSASGMPQYKKLGAFWLDHEQRRQFDSIVFAPGKDVKGAYNMWKGFSCQSVPGDCSLFLDHIRLNVCKGDDQLYDYLIGWMARTVQKPNTPGEVAIVLRGGRGTGKSFFATQFGKLFGRHFLHISNPGHLVGTFNSHLRDVVVLFADEAFFAGDKRHASILKTLITEKTITIEAKGVDAEVARNYVHLIMASNDTHVVPAGGDERRFLVLDVGKEQQQKPAYFRQIAEQMDNGGQEALLAFLLSYDLSEYQVHAVPKTDALHEQKLLSLSPEEEWFYQRLLEGRTRRDSDQWESEVLKDDLVDDYVFYTDRFKVHRRGNATSLGRFLARLMPGLTQFQRMTTWDEPTREGYSIKRQGRRYFWKMPPLEEARAAWDEAYGKEAWPTPCTQQEQTPMPIGETPF